MPWKECSVMDERLKFVARRLAGEPMAGYEFRGELQIQILCGADANPRRRMNTAR